MRSFIFLILFFCIGPFLIIGIIGIVKTGSAISHLNSAEGTVTDNVKRLFANGTFSYVPEIKFKTTSGKYAYFTGKTGTIPPVYQKGDKVSILYNPLNSSETMISSFRELWFEDALFVGISILLLVIIFLALPKDI
jgi:Protein of unknown function (DUF3592)